MVSDGLDVSVVAATGKMACAIASSTATDPEPWFQALQDGVAFAEVQWCVEARWLIAEAGV